MRGITIATMVAAIDIISFAQPIPVPWKLGEIFLGAVDAATKDVVIAYTTEPGVAYEIYLVDSYNNGADPQMKVENPSKAVVFWVLKEDGKTSYPRESYTFTEKEMDPASPYSFVGVTPEKSAAMGAKVIAEGTKLFVQVQRNKNQPAYYGQFSVKVTKPSP